MKLIIMLPEGNPQYDFECFEYVSKEAFLEDLEKLSKQYIENIDEIIQKRKEYLGSDSGMEINRYLVEVLYPYSLHSECKNYKFPVSECIQPEWFIANGTFEYNYLQPRVYTVDEWHTLKMNERESEYVKSIIPDWEPL